MQRKSKNVGLRVGSLVKIHDIGPMAKVLAIKRDQLYLSLDGNRFWCPLCIIDFQKEE